MGQGRGMDDNKQTTKRGSVTVNGEGEGKRGEGRDGRQTSEGKDRQEHIFSPYFFDILMTILINFMLLLFDFV